MDIKKLAAEGSMGEIERRLMDLDSEFNFKCRKCGKCCKHQNTILFNSRDIFHIARKLQLTPEEVCPFLEDGLCSIHNCKPTVCALFPLGRVVVNAAALEKGLEDSQVEVKYILNDIDCGSRKRVNTVRGWLARFGIPERDEFFLLWSTLTIKLRAMICELEEHHVSDEVLNLFWNAIFHTLYLDYDTSEEFLPQFQQAAEKLTSLCKGVMEVGTLIPPEE